MYRETIVLLTRQITDYQTQIRNLTNNPTTLEGMIVCVADLPLTIFKRIFNFDVLGINISTFVMSLLSLVIIIWLIKKII